MKIYFVSKKKLVKTIIPIITIIILGLFLLYQKFKIVPVTSNSETAYVAIIIDDFGNGRNGTDEFMNLSIPYTAAVMPGMPDSEIESKLLYEKGKDVILHMPMEPHNGKKTWLTAMALTSDLSNEQITKNLNESIAQVSNLVGINNHMGSKAMEDERILNNIFQIIKEKDIIFIDSKTTSKSKAKEIGEKYGVTVLERDVFLDSTQDITKIEKNIMKAAEISRKTGFAIAIGHVGEEGGRVTAQAMKNKQNAVEEMNVEFVTVTQLLKKMKEKESY